MSGADVVNPKIGETPEPAARPSQRAQLRQKRASGIKLDDLNFCKYGEGYLSKQKHSRPCLHHEVTSDNRYGAKTCSLPDRMALPWQRCGTCDSSRRTQPLARSAAFGRSGPDHMWCVFVRTDNLMLGLSNVKQTDPLRVR